MAPKPQVRVQAWVKRSEFDALRLWRCRIHRNTACRRAVATGVREVDGRFKSGNQALVRVGCRGDDRRQRRTVLDQSADVPQRRLRESGIAFTGEQRLAAFSTATGACACRCHRPRRSAWGMKVTVLPSWLATFFTLLAVSRLANGGPHESPECVARRSRSCNKSSESDKAEIRYGRISAGIIVRTRRVVCDIILTCISILFNSLHRFGFWSASFG